MNSRPNWIIIGASARYVANIATRLIKRKNRSGFLFRGRGIFGVLGLCDGTEGAGGRAVTMAMVIRVIVVAIKVTVVSS